MNKIDIIFSFDTTGSMSSVIHSVRENLSGSIERLLNDIEGINIGIIAHGDYDDFIEGRNEFFWMIEPTNHKETLNTFIMDVPDTNGYDLDECYEYVLYKVNRINWKSSIRLLVMIGDSNPHDKGYKIKKSISGVPLHQEHDGRGIEGNQIQHVNGGTLAIDWKDEATKLKENGVMIFSCDCGFEKGYESIFNNKKKENFYKTLCEMTNGFYFQFSEASKQSFPHYMVAICLKVMDGVEGIELLKQEQKELLEKLEQLNQEDDQPGAEEKREEIKRELEEITPMKSHLSSASSLTNGFIDLATYEYDSYCSNAKISLSSDVQRSSNKIRTKKKSKSRLEQYEEELKKRKDVDNHVADFTQQLNNWTSM